MTQCKYMLSKTGKKLMIDTALMEKVESLTQTVGRLQERVEDLEALLDLKAAIAENGNEPLVPWEKARAELDID